MAGQPRFLDTPQDTIEHATTVSEAPGRYPFRPVCSCGQGFRGYVSEHAAQTIADAHARGDF